MHPLEQQSAEDFRDTPHGRQLLAGFRGLRFSSDLELEFRRYLARQARSAQVLGACLLLMVVTGYHFVEWQLYADSDPLRLRELALLRFVEFAPGAAILLLRGFNRRIGLVANRLFPLLLVLVGVVAARIDIHYEASETVLAFRYGAGLLIVCSFFFLGVTFWRALISAASIIVIDVVMAALILSSSQMQVHWVAVSYYVLLLTLGAISRYIHEYSQREQFLVRQLLGWVAQHDSLTGLANRRSFDTALRQTLLQARRDGQPLALLLLDLDDFKAYNDCLGHPAGDALIRDFGELLGRFSRRPMDLAARVGGEEFALLLLNCDANSAQAIASQLLSDFVERAIPHPASTQCGCATTSIGIAMWQPGQSAEQLYQAADAALYQAKRAGKNRYVVR
ncbi:GGDEF domain-containing protein [Stutzerimonas stutzeri]|uniref:GGDEF domain-containing protein n=1 Tax=Stutzerimonas stutzeri TaxID=316 RepID=UPI0002F469AB|nr:GGDEF domain-containing protein [Stutzerimonas stutzeri]